MQKSKIEQLIELLRTSLAYCHCKFKDQDLEHIAVPVYNSMSNAGRNFHNVYHIFDVAHGLNGVSVLAAIFHDVIYYQVDRGFNSSVEKIVFEHVEMKGEQFFIKAPKSELFKTMHIIFGVKVGDTLNVFSGLNEFLSASIAVTMLEPLLSQHQLLKVIGLIESTIPFRKDPIAALVERLTQIKFPHEEMEDIIARSVDFSNRDVFNFSENDHGRFLNNTWNLISESNYSLRRDVDNFTVGDYRMALYKTYLFFKGLDPGTVFTRYKNYPTKSNWDELNKAAKENIEIGRKYLSIQLISIAAIEAVAEVSGGDAPMSLMMGDVRRRDQKFSRMEDFLNEVKNPKTGLNKPLLALLEEGRSQESSFDMKASPIGAFMYKHLGEDQSQTLFALVQNYFDKKITAQVLLTHYPKDIITQIISACAKISSTRRSELLKLL